MALAGNPRIRCGLMAWLLCAGQFNSAAPRPEIDMKDFMFAPVTLRVRAGSAVTWVNKDDEPHTVVSDSGLFRSNTVDTNETFVVTVDKPGTYHFLCIIDPKMVGTIVVA